MSEEHEGGGAPVSARPWAAISAIASTLSTAVLVGGLVTGVILWRNHEREERQAREEAASKQALALASIRDEVHATSVLSVVNAKDTIFSCLASNSEITCTVTNLSADPIATCLQGSLTQKRASGIKLMSLPVCTGRIGTLETKTLQAQWKGGFAKDICTREGGGILSLDWGECDFRSEPMDLAAFMPAAPAAATAAPK
jgi:hypothetical protein